MSALAPLLDELAEIDRMEEDEAWLDVRAAQALRSDAIDVRIDLRRGQALHSRWVVEAQVLRNHNCDSGSMSSQRWKLHTRSC